MNVDLLFLHASGVAWDEALVVFGGLAALTFVFLTRLRGDGDPAAEAVQQDKPASSPERKPNAPR